MQKEKEHAERYLQKKYETYIETPDDIEYKMMQYISVSPTTVILDICDYVNDELEAELDGLKADGDWIEDEERTSDFDYRIKFSSIVMDKKLDMTENAYDTMIDQMCEVLNECRLEIDKIKNKSADR